MPDKRIAIAPDMPMSNDVPKSGCFIIRMTGTNANKIAMIMYLILGGKGLSA